MTDITIPPEAVEAAARDVAAVRGHDFHTLSDDDREECRGIARVACLAMLKAWPGMHVHEWHRPWLGGMSGTDFILPLPENEPEA